MIGGENWRRGLAPASAATWIPFVFTILFFTNLALTGDEALSTTLS
jgi:hypothetical protein